MNNEERPPAHHFVTRLRVRHYEMDVFGHVNNAVSARPDAGWQER